MIRIIPTPHDSRLTEEREVFLARVSYPDDFKDAAKTLCDFSKKIHGIDIEEGQGGIEFFRDGSLPTEGYSLKISEDGVIVGAADTLGAQNAAATLAQIMRAEQKKISLPKGSLLDYPECSWRGVMLDLARNWHDISVVHEYVDMCRFYKVKYFHIHFCDDQSYTLPSKAFPKLSTKGRSYTEAEIKGLIEHARERGVEIIPELDVPGHATPITSNYPTVFGDHRIICQSELSMENIEKLFSELCETFADSNYVHLGGDEVDISRWTECPSCMDAYRKMGVDVDGMDKKELAQFMYASFLRRVCQIILKCGKTPVLWEGFSKEMNHLIPKEAVVMSWENLYQTTPSLLDAGFRLINCSWVPMYILAPDKYWSPRELYEWNVYYWKPCHPRSPYFGSDIKIEPTMQIEGGELLAWGDHIIWSYPDNIEKGIRAEQRLVEERVPCLAENTWNRARRNTQEQFFSAYTEFIGMCRRLKG